jgi:hypothetical protein
MSELMDKMLAGKRKAREALAALPFEEKLVLIEKMRDRSLLLAANPLRRAVPQKPVAASASRKQK